VIEMHRRAAADAQQLALEKNALADSLQQTVKDAQKRATDSEVQLQRVTDDRDTLKKKVERTSADPQMIPKRIAALEEEVNDFRVRRIPSTPCMLTVPFSPSQKKFRCGVCNDREKDSIITRCCHVFCVACIKDSIQRRHRKCPSCGMPFSLTDVHKIWL
jgi:E3 ubiquitin-protein ligase BRE1